MAKRVLITAIMSFCFAGVFSSCIFEPTTSDPPQPAPEWNTALLSNTVGAIADLGGMQSIAVRGYGLVIGLNGTGSRECPQAILNIIQGGFRGRAIADGTDRYNKIDVRVLIDKLSTAVVLVEGHIPPAAVAGDRIDLNVSALQNTQTTSLAGGSLLVCELSIERVSLTGAPLRKNPMVLAAHPELAPIFVNPFSKIDSAKQRVSLRSARIIGGGRVLSTRPLMLVLRIPGGSYKMVRQIAKRLNFRFPSAPDEVPTAQAQNASVIRIVIPREYRNRARHFEMLVLHTYGYTNPAYLATQSRQLIGELANPKSQADRIAATLESIGKSTLSELKTAYESLNPRVSFYAASTAARLDDPRAASILGRIANDDSSPYQLRAAAALAQLPRPRLANQFLRTLLDSPNPLVRIRAYEGLARNADPSVRQVRFDRPAQFALDLAFSKGAPLIYIQTDKEPRIVLFGRPPQCQAPLFYLSRDNSLTISASLPVEQAPDLLGKASGQLSLLRRTPSGDIALVLKSDPDIVSLIKTLGSDVEPDYEGVHHGLGMNYSQVVEAIYGLWQSKNISAELVLQQSDTARNLVERTSAWPEQRPETTRP